MIRYPLPDDLDAAIEDEASGWATKTATRTAKFIADGRFTDTSPVWSEIKGVYIGLQHAKCAFCEKRLEGADFGNIEHDVEHFRPKGEVKPWPDSKARARGVAVPSFSVGDDLAEGYFWLAYQPLNYVTACKTCNSTLKSSMFPIGGPRGAAAETVDELKAEKPFLIYPLGEVDDDPETIIGFLGVTPTVKFKTGHRRRRGDVTIDFFALDVREELLRGRAEQIAEYVFTKEASQTGSTPAIKSKAATRLKQLVAAGNPHASAVRSYVTLTQDDPALAAQMFDAITEFLNSDS